MTEYNSAKPVIAVSQLTKTYKTFARREGVVGGVKDLIHREYKMLTAVKGISLQVARGELLGYIGPNGAGKSTSIKMLTGILKPTSGDMQVLGFHPFRQRREYTNHIGVVFGQRTQLWWDIAVLESFRLLAKIYGVADSDFRARLDELSGILELGPLLHTPVRKLSLGERMRCDLAASLIHRPAVLFLDEPTIGLDAVAKDAVRKFLRHINKNFQTTIILTTHDLNEIEELCQRIVIIDDGQIIYDGNLATVRSLPGLSRRVLVDFISQVHIDELRGRLNEAVTITQESERRVLLAFDPQVLPTVDLVKQVLGNYEIADLTIAEPTIEEVVMKIYRK